MTIKDVFAESDLAKRIANLKKQKPTINATQADVEKAIDVKKHEIITDTAKRPDKTVTYDTGREKANGDPETSIKIVLVNRISLALQKLIVNRAVSFLFGNPVKTDTDEDKNEKIRPIAKALLAILKDNKINSHNRKVARLLFQYTEVAEYWYPRPQTKPNKKYGFDVDAKIKVKIFSPKFGDQLFPFFEETGDMTAFSRQYISKDENNNDITYFETWTDNSYTRWKQVKGTWLEDTPTQIFPLEKIPIVYGTQENYEWYDAERLINRLEVLLSNHADTNDYHASPKIVAKGDVKSFGQKGEAGAIIEMSGPEGSVEYLQWTQAPEAVKLEIDTLLRMMFMTTQTPDISFEAVKGIGTTSGVALKLLFSDAHLKVQDKEEIFDDYLSRRNNIIKAYIGAMNKTLVNTAEEVEANSTVTPFMIDDQSQTIIDLQTAVNAGILSKKTAVALNPLVDDAQVEEANIQSQQDAEDKRQQQLDAQFNNPINSN